MIAVTFLDRCQKAPEGSIQCVTNPVGMAGHAETVIMGFGNSIVFSFCLIVRTRRRFR